MVASSFVATTITGFSASAGLNAASSCSMISNSRTGSRSFASLVSTRCAISRVRSMCLRNRDSEPGAFMRSFDQSGNVGDHESAARARCGVGIGGNHAEMRLERRERIRGNFRPRRGNARDQRGFSGIREADEPHVREQFQFETQMALLARPAVFVFARSLMPRLGEVRIAISAPAMAAARCAKSLARLGEIEKLLARVRVKHDRADGHGKDCLGARSVRGNWSLRRGAPRSARNSRL